MAPRPAQAQDSSASAEIGTLQKGSPLAQRSEPTFEAAEVSPQRSTPAGPNPSFPRPQAVLDLKENGLDFEGAVSASWGPGGVRMTADRIVNSRIGGISGTLRLVLWASGDYPVFGNTIYAYDVGVKVLGQLQGGFMFENVDTGTVAYTAPPTGCYYMTVALQEYDGIYYYQALANLVGSGFPDGHGHVRFSFGGANCQVNTGCVRSATTACLQNGRFEVTADYNSTAGNGAAQIMGFGGQRAESEDSAFLWFFTPTNFEIGLKVLNGCGVNGKYWVFIGGLTNQGWTVRIRDTQTGVIKTYSNSLGHLTSTVADTGALSCP